MSVSTTAPSNPTSKTPTVAFGAATEPGPEPTENPANTRIVSLADSYHLFEAIPCLLPPHAPPLTSSVPPPAHDLPLLPVRPDRMGTLEAFRSLALDWCDTSDGQAHRKGSALARARHAGLATHESFVGGLGRGVEEHVVIVEDDSEQGRHELQQRMERTVFGADATPSEWDPDAGCVLCMSLPLPLAADPCRFSQILKSVAPHLPFLHRIKPGHAVLSAPASKPIQYRLAAAYLTPSANRARSAKLRSSPDNVDPRTLAAVHALDSIEGHHRAAIKLANDPLFRRSDGTLLCWLALQPLLSPGGNGKGNSSFSISFTRRDLAEGVIAPAASLASAADFERVFAGCTDVGDQFARYLDTHTRINALLAEVTKAAYIATLPCDAQEALLIRRKHASTPDPHHETVVLMRHG